MPVEVSVPFDGVGQWLESRGLVQAGWARRLAKLQDGVFATISQDVDVDCLRIAVDSVGDARLPSGAEPAHGPAQPALARYLVARAARDLLLPDAERTWLGYPKGTAGKLDELVREYERSWLWVCEAGQDLHRVGRFLLPELRNSARRADQTLSDLERRLREHQRRALAAAERHEAACRAQGIDAAASPDVAAAVLPRTRLAPLAVSAAERIRVPRIREARRAYGLFVAVLRAAEAADAGGGARGAGGALEAASVCETLGAMLDAPAATAEGAEGAVERLLEESGGVAMRTESGGGSVAAADAGGDGIDWGDMLGGSEDAEEHRGAGGSVGRRSDGGGECAAAVLLRPEGLRRVENDLAELEAWLSARKFEMERHPEVPASLLPHAPPEVQHLDIGTVDKMIEAVTDALSCELLDAVELATSAEARASKAVELRRSAAAPQRARQQAAEVEKRRGEARARLRALHAEAGAAARSARALSALMAKGVRERLAASRRRGWGDVVVRVGGGDLEGSVEWGEGVGGRGGGREVTER